MAVETELIITITNIGRKRVSQYYSFLHLELSLHRSGPGGMGVQLVPGIGGKRQVLFEASLRQSGTLGRRIATGASNDYLLQWVLLGHVLERCSQLPGAAGQADAIPAAASMAAVDPAEAEGASPIMGAESMEACTQPARRLQKSYSKYSREEPYLLTFDRSPIVIQQSRSQRSCRAAAGIGFPQGAQRGQRHWVVDAAGKVLEGGALLVPWGYAVQRTIALLVAVG